MFSDGGAGEALQAKKANPHLKYVSVRHIAGPSQSQLALRCLVPTRNVGYLALGSAAGELATRWQQQLAQAW